MANLEVARADFKVFSKLPPSPIGVETIAWLLRPLP